MNILITHVYSNENKGDAALLSVLIQDMKKVFPNSKIQILTLDTVGPGETFDGEAIDNSFMHFAFNRYQNRVVKLFYSVFIISSTWINALLRKTFGVYFLLPKHLKKTLRYYEEADLVIPVGGGYLRGKPGIASYIELMLLVHPFFISARLNKPTILYSQSLGPFPNKPQIKLIKKSLSKVNLIIVREMITLALLKDLGIENKIQLATDSGFLFTSKKKVSLRKSLGISEKTLLVGITVREWLDPKKQQHYEKVLAKSADYLVSRYKAQVVFIPQVTSIRNNDDDRIPSTRVFEFMKMKDSATIWMESSDHFYIKSIYADLDLMIGTRFHSVIFSLTSYIPAIAIEYEHKTAGIMKDLGLSKWVLNISRITCPSLDKLIDEILLESNAYSAHLRKVLPRYINKAKIAREITRKTFDDLSEA